MGLVRGLVVGLVVCLALAACAVAAPAAQAATFTASSITAPAAGAELFYDADSGSGSVVVSGTVTPALSASGDLLCYSAPGATPFTVATGLAVNAGSFASGVSLQAIASRACRLRLVPHGTVPSDSAAAPFTGPAVSVSERQTHSSSGSTYGYYIVSGTLPWSFSFGSLGECAVGPSYSTDSGTLGSFVLFDGNACLLQSSGIPPDNGTRSGVQIDGLNAYPPGAIPSLTGVSGFAPLSYTATFDAAHDTVAITETDPLEFCTAPGGYPPSTANCPSLGSSGVDVTQTTTLLPGGHVARVDQTFHSIDGRAHALDLLVRQSVATVTTGATPAFEFPGQPVFASHATPDSFSLFPSGPGSIFVVSDGAAAPSTSNPTGAITYSTPPAGASFTSAAGAQLARLLMRYPETLPAGGSWSLGWSFTQAADGATLSSLERVERDRFSQPTVSLSRPPAGLRTQRATVLVAGVASDPVGVASVAVDGVSAALSPTGAFSASLPLKPGADTITVVATNLAGNTATATRTVRYTPPPCVVPRLRGRRLSAAEQLLRGHACAIGRVKRVFSAKVAKGRVVKSSPGVGARRRHGFRVGLTVSRGPARPRGRR